ncbi:MAG TPA: hypothetical protein VFB38_21480 [Chthonomonadaceae bacterium]|nr:hypothetical protein [Chthonomonadaceae bacterium]
MIGTMQPFFFFDRRRVKRIFLAAVLAWIALVCASPQGTAQAGGKTEGTPSAPTSAPPPAPNIHIEFFGAERGYAVGTESVVFLCVVRNVGTAPLPENALRLRLFPAAGLDYTSGDTMPGLPALAPNQAVAFRWRLQPSDATGPLVAAVLFEPGAPSAEPTRGPAPPSSAGIAPSAPQGVIGVAQVTAPPASAPSPPVPMPVPRAVLTVVPRFASGPRVMGASDRLPAARVQSGRAWVGNDRVGVQVVAAEGRLPVLLLAGKEGQDWRALSTGVPLIQVQSGEEGQTPWWETFRWRNWQVTGDKDSATLILQGTLGARWRAEVHLTAQSNTAAINGRLRLIPLRTMRLYGVRLPRLLADNEAANGAPPKADGTGVAVASETSLLPETARIAASHVGTMTFGLTWPSALPLSGWRAAPLPTGDAERLRVLGVQLEGDPQGALFTRGTPVEFTFRLFAFAPSFTLRDASRFELP